MLQSGRQGGRHVNRVSPFLLTLTLPDVDKENYLTRVTQRGVEYFHVSSSLVLPLLFVRPLHPTSLLPLSSGILRVSTFVSSTKEVIKGLRGLLEFSRSNPYGTLEGPPARVVSGSLAGDLPSSLVSPYSDRVFRDPPTSLLPTTMSPVSPDPSLLLTVPGPLHTLRSPWRTQKPWTKKTLKLSDTE